MPQMAAMISHEFHGNGWPIIAMVPAVITAARSARVFRIGATTAIKVSGMANDNDHESGIVPPTRTPKIVANCQLTQSSIPLPRR